MGAMRVAVFRSTLDALERLAAKGEESRRDLLCNYDLSD